MGKRIISQARGHGSFSYRVRRKAYSIKPAYPLKLDGEMEIVKLVTTAGHTSPIVKIMMKNGKVFFDFAAKDVYEGQKINFNGKKNGDICELGTLENGTKVFNVELRPNDGGKLVRTSGNSCVIRNQTEQGVIVMLPSKKEKILQANCRATIGETAGQGRIDKPILKAGKMWFIKKTRNKLWPRTSAVKMNAIDHPFGSGRGKRIKSKIAKRNSPPGTRVGHLRPRRTGVRK
jgi:large subunit ribosomal protein L2